MRNVERTISLTRAFSVAFRAFRFFLIFLCLPVPAAALERAPEVAGKFYPADPKALRDQVDDLLRRAAPPPPQGAVVALIVPHAGIEFSGLASARSVNLIEPGRWDGVIVIGTGHYHGVAGAAIYPGDYATPIGKASYDAGLAKALEEASPLIVESAQAHQGEHSIEDNLPFLLRRLGKLRLVAMVMNTDDVSAAVAVGEAVAKAVRGRRVLLIASSDLSHYPSGDVDDRVDGTTLAALRTMDPRYFWETSRLLMERRLPNLVCTYCGQAAVTAVLAAARSLGANRFQLLQRFNSGDAIPEHDYGRVVGYATAAFVKVKKGSPVDFPYDLTDGDRKTLLLEAREAIRARLGGKELPPASLSAEPGLNLPAAVFVTLEAKGDGGAKSLRGCIGTTEPHEALLEAVRRYAQAAALEDPRFRPLTAPELERVSLEVSILSRPRPAAGSDAVKPGMGVTVEKDGRFGIFLPQVWDQIPDKKTFLEELCGQKAGLPRDCWRDPASRLSVFSVEKFSD